MTIEIAAAVRSILDATCGRSARQAAHPSGVLESAWKTLADAGFPWVGLPEQVGGSGGSLIELMTVLRATGRGAAPVPLAETALANWLRVQAALGVSARPSTVSVGSSQARLTRVGGQWRIDGEFARVPWARYVEDVVSVQRVGGEMFVVTLPLEACTVLPGVNLAGESRDTVVADRVVLAPSGVGPVPSGTADAAFARGALSRAAQMAGALRGVRDLTVSHATTRVQFGRPLSAFQAIQQRLALIEEESLSVSAAVDVAAHALECDAPGPAVGAAKILAGIAANDVVAHSHQVHGAIGLTMEYDLQLFVRRLAGWRWEFGSSRYWSRILGTTAGSGDGSALWATITHSLT